MKPEDRYLALAILAMIAILIFLYNVSLTVADG